MSRILSGIRPTGGIHLGNYLGALKQWSALSQEPKSECFFMVADYHALLSFRETPLRQASYDLLAWELASGLDPERVTLFVQSHIPAHTELAWIFNTLVTVSELSRMTQYKDLVAQGLEQPSSALLTYPALQAADILLYEADIVPVGEDQVQHIELTRTLARRFNRIVQTEVFKAPHARLTESARIMSLHDPSKKMSKSLPQGALLLEDSETMLRQKVARAVTDTGLPEGPFPDELMVDEALAPEQRALLYQYMSPGVRNLFVILQETSPDQALVDALLNNFKTQTLLYKDLKAAVADAVVAYILPLRERYEAVRPHEAKLAAIIEVGDQAAGKVANQTLLKAKTALNLV